MIFTIILLSTAGKSIQEKRGMKMNNYKNNLNSIHRQIENTRSMLNNLIKEKNCDLLDIEVIELSQLLDQLLSEYDKLKK